MSVTGYDGSGRSFAELQAASPPPAHDFTGDACPHPDCGGGPSATVTGYQCAECGHYFPRERVRMDPDSEPRCRIGMGCDAAPTIRHAIRRRERGRRS